MKKKAKRLKAAAADRHRKVLKELPEAVEKQHNNIFHRNQMLAATQAYNLNIERNRVKSHLSDFPSGLQRAAAERTWGTWKGGFTGWLHTAFQTNGCMINDYWLVQSANL